MPTALPHDVDKHSDMLYSYSFELIISQKKRDRKPQLLKKMKLIFSARLHTVFVYFSYDITDCLALDAKLCPKYPKLHYMNQLYATTWPLHCPQLSNKCTPYKWNQCVDEARDRAAAAASQAELCQ